MFNLIVAIIGIALSVALSLAVYFNSDFLADKRAEATAVQLANQANQIWGASALYYTERGVWPNTVADLVTHGYLSAQPQPPQVGAADGLLVSNAMAAVQAWELVKHDDGTLGYIVLPDSLDPVYCVAANLGARGEPVKNIDDMVDEGKAVVHDKVLDSARYQQTGQAHYSKEARDLPVLPTQLNNSLVYQCVAMSDASAKGSYFWMTPRFAEVAGGSSTSSSSTSSSSGSSSSTSSSSTSSSSGSSGGGSVYAPPGERCDTFASYVASRGGNAACGEGDQETQLTDIAELTIVIPNSVAGNFGSFTQGTDGYFSIEVAGSAKPVGQFTAGGTSSSGGSSGSGSGGASASPYPVPVEYDFPDAGATASGAEDPDCSLPGFNSAPPCQVTKVAGATNTTIGYMCGSPGHFSPQTTWRLGQGMFPGGANMCAKCNKDGSSPTKATCTVVPC